MKLYYSPGACSLSPHIVAREAGIDVQLEKVDTKSHTFAGGSDYYKVNPKGYVPALEVKPGEVLTEGPAIVQYLADQKPQSGLAPAAGSFERYRLQEMLGYINSEIHKTYSPLFDSTTPAETAEKSKAYLKKRYKYLDEKLAGRDFLVGDKFTAADAYLFTVTNWARHVKLDLSEFPNLLAFQKRVAARPAVQQAMKAEGLIK
ncbi:MAG: glutathione transferase GstA [Burkholderiales bacterium]|nr:glutathione transferase GstA [Burkholderiales bacterium]